MVDKKFIIDEKYGWQSDGVHHTAIKVIREDYVDKLESDRRRLEVLASNLKYIVQDIFNSLPMNRDWLDPTTERMMEDLMKKDV